MNFLTRALLIALVTLGGEEEPAGLAFQPRRDPNLRLAVDGGGVDVVDTEAEENLECFVRRLLRHGAQRRGAEDDPCALVPGAPELSLRDHQAKVADPHGLNRRSSARLTRRRR